VVVVVEGGAAGVVDGLGVCELAGAPVDGVELVELGTSRAALRERPVVHALSAMAMTPAAATNFCVRLGFLSPT
jgi:hypothetical protein